MGRPGHRAFAFAFKPNRGCHTCPMHAACMTPERGRQAAVVLLLPDVRNESESEVRSAETLTANPEDPKP